MSLSRSFRIVLATVAALVVVAVATGIFIARGSAFRNRKMFWACVDRSLAALYEIEYHLKMGYTMGLISQEEHHHLESLRGRAVFYSVKLVMDLIAPPPDPEDTAKA